MLLLHDRVALAVPLEHVTPSIANDANPADARAGLLTARFEALQRMVAAVLGINERPRADTSEWVTVLEAAGIVIIDREAIPLIPDEVEIAGSKVKPMVIRNAAVPLDVPIIGRDAAESDREEAPHLRAIGLPNPRPRFPEGGRVWVGVLDSGIAAHHLEFDRCIPFAQFDASGRLVTKDRNDERGHGTFVSALIGGQNVGVAPDADLGVARVTVEDRYATVYSTLAGLDWLVRGYWRLNLRAHTKPDFPGSHVVNVSMTTDRPTHRYFPSIAEYRNVFGVPVIASVGTHALGSPANYYNTLGVGGVDLDRGVTLPTGRSDDERRVKPDICAIRETKSAALDPERPYAVRSGASFSTALVTGVAALLMQKEPQLVCRPRKLLARLKQITSPVAPADLWKVGSGRIDCQRLF